MKGTVLAYSKASNAGVIRTDTGTTFYFRREDWPSETLPSAGSPVTFVPAAGSAKQIAVHSSR